jgi:putative ABC transport system permease protein
MRKIANLLGRRRRARMEEDLDRELRYHFDRRVEDMRAAGIAEDEARRRVAIEMGGIDQVQEDVRETWTWRWIEDAIRDARYAARSLARSPGFTATAVLSLAIGVGASAAIFSLVDQVLFRLLPVREPERLVAVDWNGNSLSYGWGPGAYMSYPLCRDLMKQDRFFDGVLCRFPTVVMLASGEGRQAEPVGAEIVSGSYFPVLGVVPAMGRHFDEQDDVQPGAHPVVVLSHAYWQTALGGAPDVVGRKVLLNGFPMTVVGVASPRFRGMDIGEAPAVWIPASMKAQATPEWDRLLDRRAGFMQVFGRLRPGVGADEAQAGLLPWFKTMLDEDMRREGFPKVTAEQRAQFLASTITVRPAPLGRSNFRQRMDRPLVVLMAGTLLLLVLASLNVASLSLARAAARSREIRTRIALGASRVRIATLLLADSLLVALAGGSLGLVVAPLVSRSLLSFLPQEAAGVDLSPAMDGRVFVFAFLVSALAGVSCGMAPAWQAGRVPLIGSLKQRWSGGADVRARKALVVGQIAFTLILLIGAGLFVQTLARLVGQGPGFETAHVVTFGLNLKRVGYTQENAQRATQRILAELRSLPEGAGLGVAGNTLLQGGSWNNFLTVEAGRRFVTDRPVHLNPVTPGFFATLGTRVIAGRDFDGRDARPAGETGGPRSAVVNESFARRYFPGGSPVGARFGLGDQADARADMEIVGVVRDFSYHNLREQTEQAFLPLFEGTLSGGWFYLRVRGAPESSLASVRTAVARVDPAVPLLGLRTFDDQVARSLTTERMLATLSTGFAAIALLLSVVGLYGVMAFVVTSRTTEIGVRMALGATRGRAVSLVVADAAAMIALGTALALPCIWAAGRVVEAQLYGVTAIDAPTIAAASLLLTLVALAAAMLPAWRAASISPTEALRFE